MTLDTAQTLDGLVRIKTAASLLGVTAQTIRNWVSHGKIRALRHPMNGYRLFDVQELQQVLNSTVALHPLQLSIFPGTSSGSPAVTHPIRYRTENGRGIREIMRDGEIIYRGSIVSTLSNGLYGSADYDRDWLQQSAKPQVVTPARTITIGDAFSGGGIFSLGIEEGLRAAQIQSSHSFGIDFDNDALSTYSANFPGSAAFNTDINALIDGSIDSSLTTNEQGFLSKVRNSVDVLLGGPPCQGHSDLNNHTRREDPKNQLYFSMARLTQILSPSILIIENVPGVVHDKTGVVQVTADALDKMEYSVSFGLVDLAKIGVPQKRKRFVLVATRRAGFDLKNCISRFAEEMRPISWAIEDLLDKRGDSIYETAATHSIENQRRIKYLFEHDLYELPNAERPRCHREKEHSYKSVYGRMRWTDPAPTITGGFGSTGQGRFVHPKLPRTLTPHEAARVQFVPDFYRFPPTVRRRSMQQIIGNAAPPKLSYAIALHAALGGYIA